MRLFCIILVLLLVLSVCTTLFMNELPVEVFQYYNVNGLMHMLDKVSNRLQHLNILTHWTRTANQLKTLSDTWQNFNGVFDLFNLVYTGFELLVDNTLGLTIDIAVTIFQLVALLGEIVGFAFSLDYDGNYYSPIPTA